MARILTNGERLRRRFSLLVLFVFIGAIRGSRRSGHEGRNRRSLVIDEVAARASFTVETTMLPSFALTRDCCGGVSVSAGIVV
jgi:hypothetical protein